MPLPALLPGPSDAFARTPGDAFADALAEALAGAIGEVPARALVEVLPASGPSPCWSLCLGVACARTDAVGCTIGGALASHGISGAGAACLTATLAPCNRNGAEFRASATLHCTACSGIHPGTVVITLTSHGQI